MCTPGILVGGLGMTLTHLSVPFALVSLAVRVGSDTDPLLESDVTSTKY